MATIANVNIHRVLVSDAANPTNSTANYAADSNPTNSTAAATSTTTTTDIVGI